MIRKLLLIVNQKIFLLILMNDLLFSKYANLRRDEGNPTYGCLSLSARFYFMRILFNGALKTAPYDFFNPTNTSTFSEKKT